tara:strand:- start:1779 stop:2111 length:333 start_codon:yes stop_codon:yes gene_type:complete
MTVQYDRQVLVEGNRKRAQAAERPSTFARYNDEVNVIPSGSLQMDNQTRMAGQMGARALELMSNPAAMQNVSNWMNQFGQSNQGAQFNMAKMQQATAKAELLETNAELGK